MKSPFAGLDPFVETCGLWQDFHFKLIGEIERKLAESLPDRYVVRIGKREYVGSEKSEYRETFIEIYEPRPNRRLVIAIEVLSPSNKRRGSEGWYQFSRKRQVFLEGYANYVEIDLLRQGTRQPMGYVPPRAK